jgi:hypothetical protein
MRDERVGKVHGNAYVRKRDARVWLDSAVASIASAPPPLN